MIPEYMAEMFKTFDELGEADVRAKLYNNTWSYDPRMLGAASEWVRLKDQAVSDAREEETLEIARASNSIAEAANRLALSASTDARLAREAAERQAFWAMMAAVTAIVALIVAIAASNAKP